MNPFSNADGILGLSAGVFFAIYGASALIALAFYVWYLWSLSRLFPKLSLPASHGWIPLWNEWQLAERAGFPGWLMIFRFIPGLNLVALVVFIMSIHRINAEHGKGAGFTVLGFFLPPVWAMMLANHISRSSAPDEAQGVGGAAPFGPSSGAAYGPGGQIAAQGSGAGSAAGQPGYAPPLVGGTALQSAGSAVPGLPPVPPGSMPSSAMPQSPQSPYAPPSQYAQSPYAPPAQNPGQVPGAAQPGVPGPAQHDAFALQMTQVPQNNEPPQMPQMPQTPPMSMPEEFWDTPVPDGTKGPYGGTEQIRPVEQVPPAPGGGPAGDADAVAPAAERNSAAGASGPLGPSVSSGAPSAALSSGAVSTGAYERLAAEPYEPRSSSTFGVTETDRPFSWPGAEDMPPAPPAPPAPVAPPAQAAPPVPAVPSAVVAEPVVAAPAEVDDTTTSSAAVAEDAAPAVPADAVAAVPVAPAAPIGSAADEDDDLDRTVVVVRRTRWGLQLPDGDVLELVGDDLIVGRKPEAGAASSVLRIPDPTRTLSKSHLRMRRADEQWTVEDLGSTNGLALIDADGQMKRLEPGREEAATERILIGTLEVRLLPIDA